MKATRMTISCLLIAMAIVAFSFVLYDGSSVESLIVGPSTARSGDLTVLSTREAVSGAWIVIPDAKHEVVCDGKLCVVTFSRAGAYTVVMASVVNNRAAISTHEIVVDGSAPEPEPGPDPGPEPDPDPDPEPGPASDWVKWAKETALSTVTHSGRSGQAKLMAGQLRSVSAKIAAGAITSPVEARVEVRKAVNHALGGQAAYWVQFSVAFAEQCKRLEDAGDLRTLRQYQVIYSSVAKGLDEAAVVEFQPTIPHARKGCANGACRIQ